MPQPPEPTALYHFRPLPKPVRFVPRKRRERDESYRVGQVADQCRWGAGSGRVWIYVAEVPGWPSVVA